MTHDYPDDIAPLASSAVTVITHEFTEDVDGLALEAICAEFGGPLVPPQPCHAPALNLRCSMPRGHGTLRHKAIGAATTA